MEMVHITINNIPLEVGKRAPDYRMQPKKVNIDIPHLCYFPDRPSRLIPGCRVVRSSRQQETARPLVPTLVWEGIRFTDTQKVRIFEWASCKCSWPIKPDCVPLSRNQNCELQSLCSRFNILSPKLPNVAARTSDYDSNTELLIMPSASAAADV